MKPGKTPAPHTRWRLARLLSGALLLFVMVCIHFDATWKSTFENFSEDLVCGVMYAAQNDLPIELGPFGLGKLTMENSPPDVRNDYAAYYQYGGDKVFAPPAKTDRYTFKPYTSQMGLQGRIFGWLSAKIASKTVYWVFRGALIAALDLVLLLIGQQLYIRYGGLLAGCFLLVSMLSPWVMVFAPNLYWLEFTWFLPMLWGLLCLNHPGGRWLFYALVYLSIGFKCLCGYEYLSTIMVGAVLFPCAEWLARRGERPRLTRVILGISAACLLGFATAFTVHASCYGKGSLIERMARLLREVAQSRTWASAAAADPDLAAAAVPVWRVLGQYLWGRTAGKTALLILLLSAACLFVRKKHFHEDIRWQASLLALAAFGAVSWFVLAKGHSWVHWRLNMVLWYLGTMQLGVYSIVDLLAKHRDLLERLLPAPKDPQPPRS